TRFSRDWSSDVCSSDLLADVVWDGLAIEEPVGIGEADPGATDANERAMLGVAPGAVVLQAALICRAARASDHVYLLRIDARETLEPGVKDVIGERPHAPLNIRLDNNAGHPLKQAGLWSGWVRALTLGNLTCIADGVMIGGLDVHHGWGLSVGMGRCGAAASWASSTIRPP